MAERAELGAVVTERLRAGGLSGSERNALRAACERSGTGLGVRERIDERLAILLAWLHVSSGRPSACGQFTDDDVVAQRGCRTSPSQSARWPNVETHNHAGDDLAGLAAGCGGGERRTGSNRRRHQPTAVCAQVGLPGCVDALPSPKDYVLALALYYSQIVCKIRF